MSAQPTLPVTEMRVSTEPGVALAVRLRNATGSGVPVLCVHGLASNARLWDAMADKLAELGHPVAALDQRGHGRSSKPDTGYDWETLSLDLVEVIGALGWQPGSDRRPVVVGQSWGGNVVLELAIRHPEAIRAVALIDGGTIELAERFADWPTCEVALMPPMLEGIPSELFEQRVRLAHPDWPSDGIAGALANVETRDDGTIAPWLSRANHARILRLLWDHRPSLRYHSVSQRVLLVPAGAPGAGDTRWMSMKRDEIERAAAALPDAAVRWVDGDHDLHAQHPDLLAELIHDLCTGGPL